MPSAFRSIASAEYAHEVLEHPTGVVVFFWSPGADACRYFIPPLEQYVSARASNPKLVKVNVDAHPEPAVQARIGAIPALLAYRGGQVVGQLIGTGGPEEVEAVLVAADPGG